MAETLLRKAAAAMRADHPHSVTHDSTKCASPTCQRRVFHHAVADWLEAVDDERLPSPAGPMYTVTHLCTVVPCRHDGTWPCAPTAAGQRALAVARAYLGEA